MRLSAGFHNISERDYHADPAPAPSLSSSIAKVLLAQTPRHAMLQHPRLNPQREDSEPSRAAEVGTAAHKLLTGKGAQVVMIDAPDYKKQLAKDMRADAYAAGHAPVLIDDFTRANAINDAVRLRLAAIPECDGALTRGAGEQVMLWQDAGDIWCRGMIDWWQADTLTAYDIKSTNRALSDYDIGQLIKGGWDVQAGLYMRGLTKLFPEHAGRMRWRWLIVEQDEPHEVRVIEASRKTLEAGDRKAAMAISKWSMCMVTGEWPGYAARVEQDEYSDYELDRIIRREENEPDLKNFEPLYMVRER